jgi:FkbM family methyltransferase
MAATIAVETALASAGRGGNRPMLPRQDMVRGPRVVRAVPYRWRLSGSLFAHLLKAACRQHHRELWPSFARLIPPDAIVFDVGAHAGQYTKLFARAARAGRVYAFEPGSYARAILRAVVWLHRLRNVAISPLALGAGAGIAILTLPVKGRGSLAFGLAHLGPAQERWTEVQEELVGLTTIDAAVAALRLDRLDFIKADVEGWELRLLRGAEESLLRFRPRLLVELSGEHLARAGDDLADAFALLQRLGYRAFEAAADGRLVPAGAPRDGDFWFVAGDDPALDAVSPEPTKTRPGTSTRPLEAATRSPQLRRVPSSCISIMNRLMKSR